MLPEWLDPESLQWVILGSIGFVVYVMFLVARFVQKAITKFLLFVILAGVGLSLWIQREDLQDCVDTCECAVYGASVDVPADVLPAECR